MFSVAAEPEAFSSGEGAAAIDVSRTNDPAFKVLSEALTGYIVGVMYDGLGENEEAVTEYRRAASFRNDVGVIHVELGSDLLLLKDLEGAASELSKALEVDPENNRARLLMALVHTAEGDYEKAGAMYAEILERDPDNFKTLAFQAELFLSQGRYDKASGIYEKMLRISENDTFLYFNLGMIYSKTNQLERAEESFKKAIEIDKGHLESQMVLGLVYEVEGNLPGAIKQYEVVTEIDPAYTKAYARAANLYYGLGESEKAVKQLRAMAQIEPLLPNSYLRIAAIHIEQGDLDSAKGILREALSNGVEEASIYAALGYIETLEENDGRAVEYYTDAVRLDPGNGLYRFYLGGAMNNAGNRLSAIRVMEECIDLGYTSPRVYNYLGYLYVTEGKKIDKAIGLIGKALEEDPDNGSYNDSMGWAFFKKGDIKKAVEYLEKAAKLAPEDQVINDHLGDAYFRAGDIEKAREAWKKALESDPENRKIRKKLKADVR